MGLPYWLSSLPLGFERLPRSWSQNTDAWLVRQLVVIFFVLRFLFFLLFVLVSLPVDIPEGGLDLSPSFSGHHK